MVGSHARGDAKCKAQILGSTLTFALNPRHFRRVVADLPREKTRWIVIGLCALAGIRVFIFAAAFPFFNNVDEQAHVDLVVKYAHAQWPRGIENYSTES